MIHQSTNSTVLHWLETVRLWWRDHRLVSVLEIKRPVFLLHFNERTHYHSFPNLFSSLSLVFDRPITSNPFWFHREKLISIRVIRSSGKAFLIWLHRMPWSDKRIFHATCKLTEPLAIISRALARSFNGPYRETRINHLPMIWRTWFAMGSTSLIIFLPVYFVIDSECCGPPAFPIRHVRPYRLRASYSMVTVFKKTHTPDNEGCKLDWFAYVTSSPHGTSRRFLWNNTISVWQF